MTPSNFLEQCARIHACTEPKYAELFRLIGRQRDGVRLLVHLRADLLEFLPQMDSSAHAKRMSENLRHLLATWFTTGLLEVERITWQSPCEIGECVFDDAAERTTGVRVSSSAYLGIRSGASSSDVGRSQTTPRTVSVRLLDRCPSPRCTGILLDDALLTRII